MKLSKILLIFVISFSPLLLSGQEQLIDSLVKEGVKLHDQGKYEEAIKAYQKALKIEPNSSVANFEISMTYFYSKDYKNAEKYSKKVIKIDEKYQLQGYLGYANALDMQGKTKKAIRVYEEAISKYDNYLLFYNHALTCYNSGQYKKAYDSVTKAILNNSSHASSHLILSKIMEKQGNRVKAMLPLYFFLLIEPNSKRASVEYKNLRNFIDFGVNKVSNEKTDVEIPQNDDPDFNAAEMMISLSKASNSIEENKGKTDLELFAENNESLFSILGELKKDNTGFWWDFYVPFYNDLTNDKLVKTFSYYISLSKGDEAVKWIDNNNEEFERFKHWLSS